MHRHVAIDERQILALFLCILLGHANYLPSDRTIELFGMTFWSSENLQNILKMKKPILFGFLDTMYEFLQFPLLHHFLG